MYGKMKIISARHWLKLRSRTLQRRTTYRKCAASCHHCKRQKVLNFCANNYLGLSNHPRLIKASQEMMDRRGYGMSSPSLHLRNARYT